ncbi:hypothetical protein V9L05_22465 (plasmid) [Bernardetia sp. Wsw4-3y2]|uniref:hypothetical protein n=1 Tax=Bernardetia sp. Wsw4-3y2 TaxID=3127471 RepID=UPI0030D20238
MSRVEKIENLLNKDLILVSVSHQISYVQIKETQADAFLKRLTIKNLPKNALVFTLDVEGIGNLYFNKSSPTANKCSDFVILYEDKDKIKALFCEIKSFNPSRPEYEKQLESSFLFVEYACKILNSFEKETKIDSSKYYLFHLYEPKNRDMMRSSPRDRYTPHKKTEEMKYIVTSSKKPVKNKYIQKIAFQAEKGTVLNPYIDFNEL